jgi:hypothetical protein
VLGGLSLLDVPMRGYLCTRYGGVLVSMDRAVDVVVR